MAASTSAHTAPMRAHLQPTGSAAAPQSVSSLGDIVELNQVTAAGAVEAASIAASTADGWAIALNCWGRHLENR